jgi:hypothetical protein
MKSLVPKLHIIFSPPQKILETHSKITNSRLAARVAERLIEVEEEGLGEDDKIPVRKRIRVRSLLSLFLNTRPKTTLTGTRVCRFQIWQRRPGCVFTIQEVEFTEFIRSNRGMDRMIGSLIENSQIKV